MFTYYDQHCSILLADLICLLIIFADQVFIDPTFFGIFVCGPLQSFVVDVCTSINPAKGTTLGTVLLSKKVERTNMLQYKL